MSRLLVVSILLLVCGAGVGCAKLMETLEQNTTEDSLLGKGVRGANRIRKAYTDLDPAEEHFVGRAVLAQILSDPKYEPVDDQALNTYVSLVGQAVALGSDEVRQTFLGYVFAVLDTDEINAFAAPGGTILITRGMLAQTTSEDELAAVLAHEIAHVTKRHGLAAIQQANMLQAFQYLGEGVAQATMKESDWKALTDVFDDSVQDVVKTLVTNGYSRSAETEADQTAVLLLADSGYDPAALERVLSRMQASGGEGGFFSTHPAPSERLADAQRRGNSPDKETLDLRTERYRAAVRTE